MGKKMKQKWTKWKMASEHVVSRNVIDKIVIVLFPLYETSASSVHHAARFNPAGSLLMGVFRGD